MSAELVTTASATGDDVLLRVGRWVVTKVWLGCVLSAGYAIGRQFGWPELLLTAAATAGAVFLALAALVLPGWTVDHHRYGVGITVIDVGVRLVVWLGLTSCAVSLLIGQPAVGSVAGALWLTTAVRTFGPGLRRTADRWRSRRRRDRVGDAVVASPVTRTPGSVHATGAGRRDAPAPRPEPVGSR